MALLEKRAAFARPCVVVTAKGRPCQSEAVEGDDKCMTHTLRKCQVEVENPAAAYWKPMSKPTKRCGKLLRAGEDVCVEHQWLVNDDAVAQEVTRRLAQIEEGKASHRRLAESIRQASADLSDAKREAARVREEIASLLEQKRDAELLAGAEGKGHEEMTAIVLLVRERRLQRLAHGGR